MSITNAQLINDALRELNVISEVDTASSEQGTYALRKLNQMMEIWRENGIEVGYFAQTTTTDTCPIPDWAEGAVTLSLALVCAPKYGASISGEMAAAGDQAMTMVQRKAINESLQNTDMSHLPIGAGHIGDGYYDINTDS